MRYLIVFSLIATLAASSGNPLGPFAGGRLGAAEADTPYADWEALATVDTVFIETRPADPYSVQTWVISVDDTMYVPTSLIMGDSAPERQWVKNILNDAAVRVQVNDLVYPMRAERVEASELQQRVLQAFQQKYASELPEIDEHAKNAWIFRMAARAG